MDIVFNCPNCDQELAVDESGAGSQIECPACNTAITIPATGKVTTGRCRRSRRRRPPPPRRPHRKNRSCTLKVPVRDKPERC